MPNPLSTVMPSPSTAPDAAPPTPRTLNGAMSFQVIMAQETGPSPAEQHTPALRVQGTDTGPELEEVIEEEEMIEISAVPEDQQPAKVRPVAQDTVPAPYRDATGKETILPPSIPRKKDKTGEPQTGSDTTAPTSASNPHPVAFQALIWKAAKPAAPTQTIAKSQNIQNSPTPADARVIQRSDPPPAVEPERDVPQSPPSVNQASKQPTPVNHAPAFGQIQLLAADSAASPSEGEPHPEIEDVQGANESTVLTTTRDTGPAVQSVTATARAETARAIASQVASVITSRAHPGTIEVALNPEELGRVSIVLNGRDDGLHMTISAERPETLDLMRRHLSVLESEFKSFDLGNLSLDLGTSADNQQEASPADRDAMSSEAHPAPAIEADAAVPETNPDGRIDIRL